ncbi:MAG TPA: thioredoxin family protein [Segetibacter sp.]|jgi:thioredoxin-related protein
MKSLILIFFVLATVTIQAADTTKALLYNPKADAAKDIEQAVAKAKAEKKHVLIQAGGNWCTWCIRFNNYATIDKQIDSILKANYVVYHLNWSPENENRAVFKKYDFPQRFGFPVFIILDAEGKRIHTQNSAYLEAVKTYDRDKIVAFLKDWSPTALDPKSYK